jgi:hypothetical protein
MWIMTEHGWVMFSPKSDVDVPCAPELYSGPLPSLECKAFIRKNEQDHVEYLNKKAS